MEGVGIDFGTKNPEQTRILLVCSDNECVEQIRASLRGDVTVIASLAELHEADLSSVNVVICSTSLPDGCGLDALAYLHGMHSDLPVMLVGTDESLAVEAIHGGAQDYLLINHENDYRMVPLAIEKCLVQQRIKEENERLQRELNRSLSEVAITNHQLQDAVKQLEHVARTDELTGLRNRRWFNQELDSEWAESLRNNLPLGCLMIDLDSFKTVNDQLGHQHGDEILKLVAKVILANSRDVDVAARYGGDEFCILMAHTEPHEAATVAERINKEFELAVQHRPQGEPRVSMSIGLSHIHLSRPANADQLLSHADEAMYAAKSSGKQRVMIRDADGVLAPASRLTHSSHVPTQD